LVESYGKLPLSFEINQGQTDSQVKFLSRGSGYSLFLTLDEALLALKKGRRQSKVESRTGVAARRSSADLGFRSAAFPGQLRSPAMGLQTIARTADPETGSALHLLPTAEQFRESFAAREETPVPNPESQAPAMLRLKLVGANPHAKVTGMDELPGKSNYFIGNDPKKWRTNVPNYAKVKYANVYPGVDLVYYGNQGRLEYDFVVAPGADPRVITLGLDTSGSKIQNLKSKIAKNGDLVVGTDAGEVTFHKPVIYQPATYNEPRTTHKEPVDGKYVVKGSQITFDVTSYDKTRPLVIDPVLVYSTYLGGSSDDWAMAIAVDAWGKPYVTGFTYSSDFPTTSGAFQTTFGGGTDVFVTKLNATGSALVYSTYLGGSGADAGNGIAIDASGNAYVTGSTESSNFPTTSGAFQTTYGGGGDAFACKLDASGAHLLYSTYLGGSRDDSASGIAVDAAGSAYLIGSTDSADFPITPGAPQNTYLIPSAFVSKLNSSGSTLLYSAYLAGSYLYCGGSGIAVDRSANAYVTGTCTDQYTFNYSFVITLLWTN
jgi:hypothetical protein